MKLSEEFSLKIFSEQIISTFTISWNYFVLLVSTQNTYDTKKSFEVLLKFNRTNKPDFKIACGSEIKNNQNTNLGLRCQIRFPKNPLIQILDDATLKNSTAQIV